MELLGIYYSTCLSCQECVDLVDEGLGVLELVVRQAQDGVLVRVLVQGQGNGLERIRKS